MANEICALCGKPSLRTFKGTYETQFIDREGTLQKVAVPDVVWQECANCGEALLDDAAMQAIEAARRHAMDLLSPRDIRDLRSRLHKTQREMSRLLGVGEKTYCRWESGAYVQSEAFDRYLRLVMALEENVRLLEGMEAGPVAGSACEAVNQETFIHLEDIELVQQAAAVFTNLLEMGQLYTAQA